MRISQNRYQPFFWHGVISEQEQPVDLTGIETTSEIRDELGVLIETIVLEKSDALSNYIKAKSDPTDWPVGVLRWNIYLKAGGRVVSTETIFIDVK